MSGKVVYGVQCSIQTFWPRWSAWNFLAWSRYGRWLLAHWLAGSADALHGKFGCGRHHVVRGLMTPKLTSHGIVEVEVPYVR